MSRENRKVAGAELHQVLPVDAQLRLRAAAATPDSPVDPLARQKAVEAAVRWCRATYPSCFK